MQPITVAVHDSQLQLTEDDKLPNEMSGNPDTVLSDKDNNVWAAVIVLGDSFAVRVRALDGDQRDRKLERRIQTRLQSKLKDRGLRKEFDLEQKERILGHIGNLNSDSVGESTNEDKTE